MSRKRSSHGRFGDQSGIGMVLVMGIGMLVLGMGFLAQRIFDGALTSSSGHVTSEQALHLSENGIDQTLARIAKNPAYSNAASFPGGVVEKAWALEQAALATPQNGAEGEFAAIKPPNRNVIYGVSWIPNRTSPRRIRVVKAEYLLSALNPEQAILVGGKLTLSGSSVVAGIAGNVHANGPINLAGNPIVSGQLTTSGVFESKQPSALPNPPGGGFESGAPEVQIETVDPLAEWYRHRGQGDFAVGKAVYEAWYDLCPDGIVRKPPTTPTGEPCTGSQAPGFNGSGVDYRGFKLSGDNWDVSSNQGYDGVYFAFRKSIKVSGNPGSSATPWRATLMAVPGPAGASCPSPLDGGDIEVSGNPYMTPYLDGLAFIAGRDLKLNGNASSTSYSGLMMAKEQIDVSGNPSLKGSLIAEGLCNSPGSRVDKADSVISGNPTITYDGGLEVKIGSIPRTTLWLEL